jgi:hypothetical protein
MVPEWLARSAQRVHFFGVSSEHQSPGCMDTAASLRDAGAKAMLVASTNRGELIDNTAPGFSSVLKRGLARDLFVESLKRFL